MHAPTKGTACPVAGQNQTAAKAETRFQPRLVALSPAAAPAAHLYVRVLSYHPNLRATGSIGAMPAGPVDA
jgi:hypothetical protein